MSASDFAARGPLHFHWAMSRGRGGRAGRPGADVLERLVGRSATWAAAAVAAAAPMFDRPFGGGRGASGAATSAPALLLLLAEEPRNGYQLMQTIEERSDGRWRPSPGLGLSDAAQLEDEGLIRATETDGQKVFEITDAGREHRRRARGRAGPVGERRRRPTTTRTGDSIADRRRRGRGRSRSSEWATSSRPSELATLLAKTRRGLLPDPRGGDG